MIRSLPRGISVPDTRQRDLLRELPTATGRVAVNTIGQIVPALVGNGACGPDETYVVGMSAGVCAPYGGIRGVAALKGGIPTQLALQANIMFRSTTPAAASVQSVSVAPRPVVPPPVFVDSIGDMFDETGAFIGHSSDLPAYDSTYHYTTSSPPSGTLPEAGTLNGPGLTKDIRQEFAAGAWVVESSGPSYRGHPPVPGVTGLGMEFSSPPYAEAFTVDDPFGACGRTALTDGPAVYNLPLRTTVCARGLGASAGVLLSTEFLSLGGITNIANPSGGGEYQFSPEQFVVREAVSGAMLFCSWDTVAWDTPAFGAGVKPLSIDLLARNSVTHGHGAPPVEFHVAPAGDGTFCVSINKKAVVGIYAWDPVAPALTLVRYVTLDYVGHPSSAAVRVVKRVSA